MQRGWACKIAVAWDVVADVLDSHGGSYPDLERDLLPSRAVDGLAEQVGVTVVPGILLDHVQGDPADVTRPAGSAARALACVGERAEDAARLGHLRMVGVPDLWH